MNHRSVFSHSLLFQSVRYNISYITSIAIINISLVRCVRNIASFSASRADMLGEKHGSDKHSLREGPSMNMPKRDSMKKS